MITKAMLEGGSEVWLATNQSWQMPNQGKAEKQAAGYIAELAESVIGEERHTLTLELAEKKEKAAFVGFGTFSTSERAAREGRNPATGKTIKIAAKTTIKFKAGSALSDSVNKK